MSIAHSPAPRIAVIIPAYKQPGLLTEAIVSVLRQSEPAAAVVVDDGCPMPETRDVAQSFSRAYAGRVFVLRRPNGGLSAARNTGIDFVLGSWPEIEAVMFLDADNRIEPKFLARALAALSAAPEDIGWIYPDIDMIGLQESWSMRGAFSLLTLLDSNYCDAGSVVRRAVLARGMRFDENLREGFEDWDFWLQAAEAGFRGQHLPNAGFRYRRRGESMASAASRRREIIVAAMHEKRRAMLRPRNLLDLEAREAPRFAIIVAGESYARFTSDPAAPGEKLSLDEVATRLRAFHAFPAANHAPPCFCFASRKGLENLSDSLTLASIFWQAQVLLRGARIVRVFFGVGQGAEVRLRRTAGRAHEQAELCFVSATDLATAGDPDTFGLDETAQLEILLPPALFRRDVQEDGPATAWAAFSARFLQEPPARRSDWRPDGRPPRNDLIGLYERICNVGAPLPMARPGDSPGEIGFLIPVHSFGGVEKVVANQARVLREAGFRPHLFISSGASFLLTQETRAGFVSVNLLLDPTFDQAHHRNAYFGAAMSKFEATGDGTAQRDAIGLLCTMDVVINTHSLGGHGVAGRLRECGVRMMASLHLVERDACGVPLGNPHMALAYEQSYERILVISEHLRAWCVAHGVPEQKILLLPNAPSYKASEPPDAIAARRAARTPGPLRILFLGRLDAQKGIDRLAKIIEATRDEHFDWRVIGKAVIADPDGETLDLGVPIESPLHDPDELDAAYDWADVLILPSRFEGAPLTILEARRRGVVVIATQVGAVAETIGQGSYLVDPAHGESATITEFVALLKTLSRDRDLLEQRWRAILTNPLPEWEETTAAMVAEIAER
jgi:glycosyltransferase involved in cell wall biosynthesis/GT2 family glycosyltransferase